jgi:hypothetical protein
MRDLQIFAVLIRAPTVQGFLASSEHRLYQSLPQEAGGKDGYGRWWPGLTLRGTGTGAANRKEAAVLLSCRPGNPRAVLDLVLGFRTLPTTRGIKVDH